MHVQGINAIDSLLAPDGIEPSQRSMMAGRSPDFSPTQHLMLAILRDAIACYLIKETVTSLRKQRLRREAEFWISDRYSSALPFGLICQNLNLNPRWLANKLRSAREGGKQFSGRVHAEASTRNRYTIEQRMTLIDELRGLIAAGWKKPDAFRRVAERHTLSMMAVSSLWDRNVNRARRTLEIRKTKSPYRMTT